MAWNRPVENGEAVSRPLQKRSGDRYGFAYCWRNRPVRGAVAGVIVVLGVVVAAWLLWPDAKHPPSTSTSTSTSLIREVKPAAAPTNAVEVQKAPERPKPLTVNGQTHPDFVPIGLQRLRKKVHKVRTNNLARLGPQPYRNATEQVLTEIFMRQLGDLPPPVTMLNLPDGERKNLIGLLISKTEISDKDSEEMAVAKETLQAAKREMIEYLKEGGTADDFLGYYYNKLESAFQQHRDAQSLVMKTCRESPEIAADFARKVNMQLKAKGIREVMVPPKFQTEEENPQ